MKKFYPAFLDLEGRNVLVVGGGAVALHKAISLGEAGARITVVAPDTHADMRHVPGVARIVKAKFKAAHLAKGPKAPWLVVAATDDEKLNAAVAAACAKARVWANVVDRPALCSFIVPAVVHQGLVTFAVSTGGASPALAKFLAGRLGTSFGPEIGALAEVLGALRPRLKELPMEQRKRVVEKALAGAAEGQLSAEAIDRMRTEILSALEEAQGESHGKS